MADIVKKITNDRLTLLMQGSRDQVSNRAQSIMDERYERGAELVSRVYGSIGAEFLAQVRDVAPDLPRYVREFAFGDIYARPGLDPKSRETVILASLITLGDTAHEIRAHTHGALNLGVTEAEIVEIVIQTAVYAGFPRAIAAMRVVADVIAERRQKG